MLNKLCKDDVIQNFVQEDEQEEVLHLEWNQDGHRCSNSFHSMSDI